MKKVLITLALSLSLLGCRNISIEKRLTPLIDPPVIEAPVPTTSDENVINELIKNTPKGYTLLGDAVSGWYYVCTSSSCGNGPLSENNRY